MKNTLMTDRAFLSLSIPFPPEQQAEFEKDLIQNGCMEPIITWNGVIIDGYKRYRLCCDEGIEYTVEEMIFPSEEEAICWVCRRRIPQYDKLTAAYRYLVGKLYAAQKIIYHAEQKLPEEQRTVRLDPSWDRVSLLIAEELNIHRATIESYGMYAAAMDQIADKSWQLFQAILAGAIRMSYKETQSCASMSEWRIKEFCKKNYAMYVSRDKAEKIRQRQKRDAHEEHAAETPLAVGVKEMPVYDPDMELKGLMLTIPTWIMVIRRVENKTEQATEQAKVQLSSSLKQLREQIDEMLGVIGNG